MARRRKKVLVQWGKIEVLGGRAGKYHWRQSPQQLEYVFETSRDAIDFVRWQSERKQDKGYDKLPAHARILRRRST